MAQRAETIFTMLPSSPQVKDVYLGDKGILQGINKRAQQTESICIDSTTLGTPYLVPPSGDVTSPTDVDVAKEVAAQVEAVGTSMVDAPVSGGEPFDQPQKEPNEQI